MKTFALCTSLALVLAALAAAPAAAAPWCETYCSCQTSCFTQCYDSRGSNACMNYICDEFCFAGGGEQASLSDELLRQITAPPEGAEAGAPAADLGALPSAAAPSC